MHIVTVKRLQEACERYLEATAEIGSWIKIVKAARWRNFEELRANFPDADDVGGFVVFNIRRNRYRLIVAVHYAKVIDQQLTLGHVYIGSFITHKRVRPVVRFDVKEEGGMATVLANPAKMIESGAPHVIHSEKQLAAYTKALYRLTAEHRPTAAQLKAIELLTLLIERYEEENFTVPKASPVDVLRFLLEQHGLRQRDVAPELGSESVVSEVLAGKRRLNAAHIEQLSKRFHVSPAVFFPN